VRDDRLELRIELDAGADADAEERDDAARALRTELLDLDVDAVDQPTGPAPPGTRSGEALTLGTLIVTMGPSMLAAVSGMVQSWMARRGDRRVTLELGGDRIELSGASDDDQRRLIEAFVARHGRR
jgi:hypothetical protein